MLPTAACPEPAPLTGDPRSPLKSPRRRRERGTDRTGREGEGMKRPPASQGLRCHRRLSPSLPSWRDRRLPEIRPSQHPGDGGRRGSGETPRTKVPAQARRGRLGRPRSRRPRLPVAGTLRSPGSTRSLEMRSAGRLRPGHPLRHESVLYHIANLMQFITS
ncbi:hypothetical protein AV530_014299 [Patagioenas fasciata monilis]|uniref:Uncharacterized protein n=1 Tax=Patagioenas fasciata monilis TaxID=372326 RepID=A0A1V4KBG6_PATFA|nr:hypothetical protein AV530_014299 [Patagioenas fasciata monilis]